MIRKISAVGFLAISLACLNLSLSFGQEKPVQAQPAVSAVESETQWLWGEVVSLSPETNELTVKYLDYDSDLEKDIVLGVDEKTTFENIKAFADIKVQDTVSIDYIAVPEGKNLAKNISVEKPEGLPAAEEEAPKEKIASEPITAVPQASAPESATPEGNVAGEAVSAQPDSQQ